MASRIMPIPTIPDQQTHLGRTRGALPGAVLSVVATLAVIAPVAIFFRLENTDPQVSDTLQDNRAGQQQTTSGIEAINDRRAAENFLARRPGTKVISNRLAAEDQFIALSARLSALQDAMTRIMRDNADRAEQLRATQTQMAQDNASVAEQLKALTQKLKRLRQMARGATEQFEESHAQTPSPQPGQTPAIPERRQNVMRNWF
jgi:hypothetical protein